MGEACTSSRMECRVNGRNRSLRQPLPISPVHWCEVTTSPLTDGDEPARSAGGVTTDHRQRGHQLPMRGIRPPDVVGAVR